MWIFSKKKRLYFVTTAWHLYVKNSRLVLLRSDVNSFKGQLGDILIKSSILYTRFHLKLTSSDRPQVLSSVRMFFLISDPEKIDLHNIRDIHGLCCALHSWFPDFASPGYMNMIPFFYTEKFMTIIRDVWFIYNAKICKYIEMSEPCELF